MPRYVALAMLLAPCADFWFAPAHAGAASPVAPYPSRPIRLLVGFPPGGTSDIVARALAERLVPALGQQIVVDNRAGAAGNIAVELAAKASADGYIMLLSSGSNTVAPSLNPRLGYDIERDFAHVTRFADVPFMLVVPAALPVASVSELIALAKARPGELNFASSGLGTPAHLAGELFKQATGVNVVHVAYKGTAPALVDLLAARVQFYFTSFPGALAHVQGGRLRAIAVTKAARSPILPQVPTLTEAGVPDYRAGSWYGVSLPVHAPRGVVGRLHAEIQSALRDAGLTARLGDQGLDVVPGVTPEQFARFVREDRQRWARVIERAGIGAR
ncbi:MAG: tripartite tricarboxylate transporter substrate binding protein [Betaproteobacteria bacterium]|nr:tripartite tricarboxylate transporter substrate binding protein [Betaproteobacteria bacterium]MBI3937289.1 tripartite tricarboxylate transporter substrate binding protein [Betaproteobacteria bacterium]